MPPTVVGLIGRKRAGKSTTAAYLETHYGARQMRHSAVLEEVLVVLGLNPRTRKNCSDLFLALKERFGEDVITRRIIADIHNAASESTDLTVIDGIRWPAEVRTYQRAFWPHFHLVTLTASQEVRYARQIADQHGRPGEAQMSFAEFVAAEATGGDAGIAGILGMGQPLMNESTDLHILRATIDAFALEHGIARR